ncbi:MAG: OadG family protein [Lachnospiraceae bacterium]|nr:OadG family protein [Lachnospiraceae bacterium]
MTLLAAATNLAEAFQNTIVGLGTVFLVLAFLILVISSFKLVNQWDANRQAKNAKETKAAAPAPAAAAPAAAPAPVVPAGPGRMSTGSVNFADEVEGPVAAAILAAVAEELGGNFRVTSIKKA